MRRAIRRVLRMEGYAIDDYASAEDADAGGIDARVHCLVLDVHLPGRSGIALWEGLAPDARPPTVFITAFDDARLRERVDRACGWLAKPFAGDALVRAIARVAC
ncbi:MAG: response regulator [Proteobacteria bacterium]|nr:response regulator [Pseudomonadota bacterium]